MKASITFIIITLMLLSLVGVAIAEEMSGEVTAVDAAKGNITLKSGTADVGFNCEEGSLIKYVKLGDQVNLEYNKINDKNIATKVSPKKKAAGY